jgi:hypothetical protein
MQLISQYKMEEEEEEESEEIVRKVISRKSCVISGYKQNGCSGSNSQSPLNLHRSFFKHNSIKPCMTSTPQKFRRKTIDNLECETIIRRKERAKTCRNHNDLIRNITPVKSQKTKHGFGLMKGITSLGERTDKGTEGNQLACVYRNVCGESFDITALGSPTQSRMLSLDESMLEAVDLDSAVKNYWDSQNRNLNLDNQSVECEDRCGSPDLFEGGLNVVDDEIMKFSPHTGGAIIQSSESHSDVGNPSNRIVHKHMVTNGSQCKDQHVGISSDQNTNLQSMDVAWGSDSVFEAVISNIDQDTPISNSSALNNMPLGEKIRQALITNVQKPVIPKPKSVQLNVGHVQESSPSSTNKLSTSFDAGPFFGLPLKVKSLIQKFKGITDLYRKFCV